jgi:AcrR family transcriptional regulator
VSTSTRRRRAVSDQDKSQRRDEIMAAAKEVFARKGFHATTIADIAKQAGLAYGSVYWYFDSKDELFQALMAVEEGALRSHIAAAVGARQDGDGEAPFRTAVQATFEFFESDKATVKLLSATPTRWVTGSKNTSAASTSGSSMTSKASSWSLNNAARWWPHRPGWWPTPSRR